MLYIYLFLWTKLSFLKWELDFQSQCCLKKDSDYVTKDQSKHAFYFEKIERIKYLIVLCLFKWCESHSVMSNSLGPHGLYSPWNSPGQYTGVGSLSLLQRIFATQGSSSDLLHCRQFLYQLNCEGSPGLFKGWYKYKFSSLVKLLKIILKIYF